MPIVIDGFEWNEVNAIKNIVHHDVYPDEVQEVFYNRYKLRKTSRMRYLIYGITDGGRYLFAVFVLKRRKSKNFVRIISARDMTRRERSYYIRK